MAYNLWSHMGSVLSIRMNLLYPLEIHIEESLLVTIDTNVSHGHQTILAPIKCTPAVKV